MLKVLHVVYNSHPDVTGAAVRTRYLVETQARMGVRPVVLSSPFQPPADPAQAWGVECWKGIPHYRCYNGCAPSRFMAPNKPLGERASKLASLHPFIKRVRQVALQEQVDVIHAHNLFFCGLAAALAGRALRLPVVYEMRSLIEEGVEGAGAALRLAYRLLDGLCCRLASHVIVLSEGLRGELMRRGVPEGKITLAGNGVDLEAHSPAAECNPGVRERLGFEPNAFVLGYIGTLTPYEGLDLLIEAVASLRRRHPQLRVLIAGEGPGRAACEQRVHHHALERVVRFVGRVPHDQVADYYSAVDLFVLPRRPSRITDLVTPLKPLEIMAHGKPLLAGDCGGHREIVIDGVNGTLFPAGMPGELARRIEEMMADPEGLARLGRQARQWVSEHRSWESQCRPVIELYDSLAGQRRPAGSRVLLVGPAPRATSIACGVENGVAMILRSPLAGRHGIRVWNRVPAPRPDRRWRIRIARQIGQFTRFGMYLVTHWPAVVHIKTSAGVSFIESAGFALLGRVLGRRVLLQLHSGEFEKWYRRRRAVGRWAIRCALRLPSEILVLSQSWRRLLARLAPGRPIHIVPNGVEIPREASLPKQNGGRLRVLTIATLDRQKGHFDILAAATRLRSRPVRFVLAGPDEVDGRGEGAEVRRRAIALRLADSVDFVGAVGPREKWRLLAEADVFLFPSRAEGMPNAVLEAMAAGLPVVATPVGSLPDMLEEGKGGRFIAVGDFEGLAEALVELLENPDLRLAMGRWNRAQAEARFSFDLVARRLDALYRGEDRKSTRLNSSHSRASRMPSSA